MTRRAIWLLPLFVVPIIIGGIVGGLLLLPPLFGLTVNQPVSAVKVSDVSAHSVPAARTEANPAPTLQPAQTAEFDAEDRLLTALYHDRSPAVVAIRVQGRELGSFGSPFQLPEPEDSPAPDEAPMPDPHQGPEFRFMAQGSGFLLDGDGHIVTNNHVIEGANLIEITFSNGLITNAKVVGADPDSDVAVLKVEELPEGILPLPLGDSSQVEVGQRAVAIGNPFGLRSTLTVGVVSARGRTVRNRQTRDGGWYSIADVIQTDAAINPGNSGGPLFNSRGEVIGVNTAIRSESGTFEGVGYAIPSNTVRKVSEALVTTGSYQHPYLGVSMYELPLSTTVARQLKLPVTHGIFVSSLVAGGPAAKAGLRASDEMTRINGLPYPAKSDIIVAIDDRSVFSFEDILGYLATETKVGQTVTLTILRTGQQQEVQVTLGARPRR